MKNGLFKFVLGMVIGASALYTYDQCQNGNLKKMYNNMMFKKGMTNSNTQANKSL